MRKDTSGKLFLTLCSAGLRCSSMLHTQRYRHSFHGKTSYLCHIGVDERITISLVVSARVLKSRQRLYQNSNLRRTVCPSHHFLAAIQQMSDYAYAASLFVNTNEAAVTKQKSSSERTD